MTTLRAVRCSCGRCFADEPDDKAPARQISPEVANVVAAIICTECKERAYSEWLFIKDQVKREWREADEKTGDR